jgi:hypothetical protein
MAPERRWGNCERGKWIEELFSCWMSAARPACGGMDRSWLRGMGGMRGEYWRRWRRILCDQQCGGAHDLLVAHALERVGVEKAKVARVDHCRGLVLAN